MFKFIATLFAAIFAFAAAHAAGAPSFQTGQRWTVKDSTTIQIVIGRIDPFGDSKTAISISVFGVPCPPTAGCTTTVVAHAPFDSETLATSVDKIVDTNAQTASAFEEGYETWKNAKGGIFTIPVSQLPVHHPRESVTGDHLQNTSRRHTDAKQIEARA